MSFNPLILVLFFISVVLETSESQADKLLDHYLELCSSLKWDKITTVELLKTWKFLVEEHFDRFGTGTIVNLIKALIADLPHKVANHRDFLACLKAILALIMKLYRRNLHLESTTKNAKMLAIELLQEVIDVKQNVLAFTICVKKVLKCLVINENFLILRQTHRKLPFKILR